MQVECSGIGRSSDRSTKSMAESIRKGESRSGGGRRKKGRKKGRRKGRRKRRRRMVEGGNSGDGASGIAGAERRWTRRRTRRRMRSRRKREFLSRFNLLSSSQSRRSCRSISLTARPRAPSSLPDLSPPPASSFLLHRRWGPRKLLVLSTSIALKVKLLTCSLPAPFCS